MRDERREHLLLVVDQLVNVWNAWSANSDVRYITRSFEDAVNDCLFVFGDGSIPGDLRTMNARIDTLREQWEAWTRKNETSNGRYPLPENSFWKALEGVEAARQAVIKPTRRNLETIAELTAQKVPDAQICRIYGFTDTGMPNGSPEPWKLQEERATPGLHTDRAKGWLPPWEKQQQEDDAKQREIVARIQRTREGKLKLLTAVAPEPIEDLIAQGVSGKQICKMKKIDEAGLAAYCEEHGLATPTWQAESPNQMVGAHDYIPDDEPAGILSGKATPERPATRVATEVALSEDDATEATEADPTDQAESVVEVEGEMTLEQEIVMYHKLGTMTPTEIAAAVSREGSEISRQKVNAVVKRYETEPAAFETAEA